MKRARGQVEPGCILAVDDEPLVRGCWSRAFAGPGREVLLAASAEAALELLGTRRPDVVVLDLVMPGMGGEGLLRCLLVAEEGHVPPAVLVVSGQLTDERERMARRLGAAEVVAKGVRIGELRQLLNRLLQARRDPALSTIRAWLHTPLTGFPMAAWVAEDGTLRKASAGNTSSRKIVQMALESRVVATQGVD